MNAYDMTNNDNNYRICSDTVLTREF